MFFNSVNINYRTGDYYDITEILLTLINLMPSYFSNNFKFYIIKTETNLSEEILIWNLAIESSNTLNGILKTELANYQIASIPPSF